MKIPSFLLSLAALGACQSTTDLTPPQPTPTDGNVKGSSQCKTISYGECDTAILFYESGQLYKEHTEKSYVLYHLLSEVSGCKAEYYCDDEATYETGVTGKTIQDA